MTLSTLEDLWERIHQFPDKIDYYDKTHNVEETIYWDEKNKDASREQMMGFVDEHKDYLLDDFELQFEDGEMYLYVDIEKEEDEE